MSKYRLSLLIYDVVQQVFTKSLYLPAPVGFFPPYETPHNSVPYIRSSLFPLSRGAEVTIATRDADSRPAAIMLLLGLLVHINGRHTYQCRYLFSYIRHVRFNNLVYIIHKMYTYAYKHHAFYTMYIIILIDHFMDNYT